MSVSFDPQSGELFYVTIKANSVKTGVLLRASSPSAVKKIIKSIASFGPVLDDDQIYVMGHDLDVEGLPDETFEELKERFKPETV